MTHGNHMKELLLAAYSDENLINPSTDGSHSIIFSRQRMEEQQNSANVSENLLQGFTGGVGTIFIALVLGIFILLTIIGNVYVIFAIATEKNLKGLANWLILSLAVADLMVATLVLPLSAYNEVNQQIWSLGPELCMMWT
ncbi:5-hydroxytryptamine receptor [Caerostris darwini]|uniref:5-hydroxytryptamine receptor n=1 Tax=Caerostris darwini TaxID=1538125 RepID=A0AAV4WRD2_9ARAC|nr:5-hydroxytryptamine receptor [Caerostris darwini]